MSWPTASVSDCRTTTRSGSVPSTAAASWVCTVVVPLPNSAVPTRSVYVPSGSSAIEASAKCPRGGIVAIMAVAMPSPTCQLRSSAPATRIGTSTAPA